MKTSDKDTDLDLRSVGPSETAEREGVDMTPMVDVTFLLLIFFMVTASFMVQKSMETPAAVADKGASDRIEILQDLIEVGINQDNTYYVSAPGIDDVEAPSDSELRTQIKQVVEQFNLTEMKIVAHVDSIHSKLVTACDAGAVNGIESLQVNTTTEDF